MGFRGSFISRYFLEILVHKNIVEKWDEIFRFKCTRESTTNNEGFLVVSMISGRTEIKETTIVDLFREIFIGFHHIPNEILTELNIENIELYAEKLVGVILWECGGFSKVSISEGITMFSDLKSLGGSASFSYHGYDCGDCDIVCDSPDIRERPQRMKINI